MCEFESDDAVYIGCDPCDVNFRNTKLNITEYFVVNNDTIVKRSYKGYPNKNLNNSQINDTYDDSCDHTKEFRLGKIRIKIKK